MATTSVRPPPAEVIGRQFVRDPDIWILLASVSVGLLSALQILLYPMGRSLAEFAVSGRELLLGGAPGTTYWSLRAPGIAILHAATQYLFGPSTAAMRAVELGCLFVLAFVLTKLAKRVVGLERVGTVAASLAIFVYAQLEYEYAGQPEIFASSLVAAATLLCLGEPSRHERRLTATGIGLLLGMATVFVPLFALVVLPLGVHLVRSERDRAGAVVAWTQLAVVVLSMLGPVVLVALWLWSKHALGAFTLDWLVPQFRLWTSWSLSGFLEWSYYVSDRLLLRQSAILPAGCLVAFTMPGLHRAERAGRRLLLGIVTAMLVAFAVSGESNPGRLSGAIPLLSLLAAIGIYKLYRYVLNLGPSALVAFWSGLALLGALCTTVAVAPGSFFWRSFTRLKFITGAMPYHARELLEGALYSNAQNNLNGVRRVQARIERLPAAKDLLIQGDEPILLWALKQRPKARLIRPLSEDMAVAAPELDVKLSDALSRLRPRYYATSPWAAAMPAGSFATRLGPSRDDVAAHCKLLAVTEGWALWEANEPSLGEAR